ncbi:MAG: sensor histidine kinase, partial [Parvibaculales bacterium]
HDLRAPLTRLRVRLETVLAKTENDEIAEAIDDVDGLLKSFNALLTLSRLDSGIATLEAWPVNINELLDELHDLFAPLFEQHNMRLELSCADNMNLSGDADLLGQALVNLLENVLAHGVEVGSSVELAARQEGDKVILSLADGGKGIAPQRRNDALERFVQLDASRTKGGSGLGLSLVAAICTHHGGELHLANNEPGLRVEMHLPVKA